MLRGLLRAGELRRQYLDARLLSCCTSLLLVVIAASALLAGCAQGAGVEETPAIKAILDLYDDLSASPYEIPELNEGFGAGLDKLLEEFPNDRTILETVAMKHPDADARLKAADALLADYPRDSVAYYVKSVERLLVKPPAESEARAQLTSAAKYDAENGFYDFQKALLTQKLQRAQYAIDDLREGALKPYAHFPPAGIDGFIINLEISGEMPNNLRYLRALKLVPETDYRRIRQFVGLCVSHGTAKGDDIAIDFTLRFIDRLDDWNPTPEAITARMDLYRMVRDKLMVAVQQERFRGAAEKVRKWSNDVDAVGSTIRQVFRETRLENETLIGMHKEHYMQKLRELREKASAAFERVEGFRLRR